MKYYGIYVRSHTKNTDSPSTITNHHRHTQTCMKKMCSQKNDGDPENWHVVRLTKASSGLATHLEINIILLNYIYFSLLENFIQLSTCNVIVRLLGDLMKFVGKICSFGVFDNETNERAKSNRNPKVTHSTGHRFNLATVNFVCK